MLNRRRSGQGVVDDPILQRLDLLRQEKPEVSEPRSPRPRPPTLSSQPNAA